ncbi:hypothetical protein F4678DRAFT_20718 [Xylaria arbuscula]|nr:hypothetical protein F4678DRAFT_20718 [Xylaria arbuscula]
MLITPGGTTYTFGMASRPPNESGHGSGVAAQINGYQVGTCKRCHVVWFQLNRWDGYEDYVIPAIWLIQLCKASDDILEEGRQGKTVINMSFSSNLTTGAPWALRSFSELLNMPIEKYRS